MGAGKVQKDPRVRGPAEGSGDEVPRSERRSARGVYGWGWRLQAWGATSAWAREPACRVLEDQPPGTWRCRSRGVLGNRYFRVLCNTRAGRACRKGPVAGRTGHALCS